MASPPAFPTSARTKRQPDEPIDAAEFLREAHHHYYGRPWVLGRYYVDELIAHGVRPTDRVLDLGCGAGRVGVWLTAYLDADRYCGIDSHLRALVAFASYECVLHGLDDKRPRLMLSEDFDVAAFGDRFDVVLDFYVTPHLSTAQAERALVRVAAACRPGARLFSVSEGLDVAMMAAAGFVLQDSFRADYPLLAGTGKPASDPWQVFILR